MSGRFGALLLWFCFCVPACCAIAAWRANDGDWGTALIFAFLAGNANAFALAAFVGWRGI